MVDLSEFDQFIVGPSEEQFSQGFQETKNSNMGWPGVGQDILQGAKDAPAAAIEGLKSLGSLPSEVGGIFNQAATDPYRLMKIAAKGMGKTGEAIDRLPLNIQKYLQSKGIIPEGNVFARDRDKINWDEFFMIDDSKPGDALAQGAVGFSPFGQAAAITKAGKAGRAVRQAGAAGVYEGINEGNPITGSLSSLGMDVPFNTVGKLAQPWKGRTTAKTLEDNMRAMQDTAAPLGSIIESPSLSKTQTNLLDNALFSGAEERGKLLTEQVNQRGLSLVGGELGRGSQNALNLEFKKALDQAFNTQKKRKNTLYKPVDELAKSEGFFPELTESKKFAKGVADEINDSPLLKNTPELRNTLQKMLNIASPDEVRVSQSKILDAQGNPITSRQVIKPDIQEVKNVSGLLFDEANKLEKSTNAVDRNRAATFKKLSNLLRKDIKTDLMARGSDDLKKAYAMADKNYKENFAPFLDKEIYKYRSPEYNADAIAREIIVPGTEDKFTKIKKIQNLMPEYAKNKLGLAYLSGAFDNQGNLNPKELSTRIKRLGKNQMKELFPDPVTRQTLNDFKKLREGSEEALSAMVNPKTGARLGPAIKVAQAIGAVGAEPITAATTLFGPAVASEILNSDWFKKMYLNSLMKQKKGQKGVTEKLADLNRFQAFAQRDYE